MSREAILQRVRTALGRTGGAPPPPPAVRIRIPEVAVDDRIASLRAKVEALAGKTLLAGSPAEAREYVANVIAARTAVASNAPVLAEWGIAALPGVSTGFYDREELRVACAAADFGITAADYALADTGTLVMFSSQEEARLISLLPPVHLALVPRERILTGLDELLTLHPQPMDRSCSMVLITGPSRTADIEQILVRGVHGPGEIHVVVV
ncbi:MAG: lactate utilization protein [Bryobacterales bacterium]|nr:lactate utilization protein [Bryobacterales bacterium]